MQFQQHVHGFPPQLVLVRYSDMHIFSHFKDYTLYEHWMQLQSFYLLWNDD